MASMSVDYYTRLEQGRESNPSRQVVDSLSKVFDLELAEQRYLYRLADLTVDPPLGMTQSSVSPELQRMMETWTGSAAYILDPVLDILAMNALARSLFDQFSIRRNMAEMVFLDPVAGAFYPDWTRAAETTVAMLRLTSPLAGDRDRLEELITDLSSGNTRFGEMWSVFDVVPQTTATKTLTHPQLGTFDIQFHSFEVSNEPGHQLIVYQAKPGSELEKRIAGLGQNVHGPTLPNEPLP